MKGCVPALCNDSRFECFGACVVESSVIYKRAYIARNPGPILPGTEETLLMASTRPYEVVVWGATGTVGKLVCEHVAQNYQVTTALQQQPHWVPVECISIFYLGACFQ